MEGLKGISLSGRTVFWRALSGHFSAVRDRRIAREVRAEAWERLGTAWDALDAMANEVLGSLPGSKEQGQRPRKGGQS